MNSPLEKIANALQERRATIAVAESCTGGLLAGKLTSIAGASAFFRGGIVTYATETKTEFLGVPAELIARCGVVSTECATAMARGVAEKFCTEFALSTTGFAGPGGGTQENPVGTVFIGIFTPQGMRAVKFCGKGTREEIRQNAVAEALRFLAENLFPKS